LWHIPVGEYVKIYTSFYKALIEGKPEIEALKAARQAVRAQEPPPISGPASLSMGEDE